VPERNTSLLTWRCIIILGHFHWVDTYILGRFHWVEGSKKWSHQAEDGQLMMRKGGHQRLEVFRWCIVCTKSLLIVRHSTRVTNVQVEFSSCWCRWIYHCCIRLMISLEDCSTHPAACPTHDNVPIVVKQIHECSGTLFIHWRPLHP
jgi:hypothetical protein